MKSGDYSLHYFDNDRISSLNVTSDFVKVDPQQTYLIKMNAYQVQQTNRFIMDVTFYNSDEEELDRERRFYDSDEFSERDWMEMSQFVEAPEDAAYVTLGFYSGGVSITEFYLDDASISTVDEEDLALQIDVEGQFKNESSAITVTDEAGKAIQGAEVFVVPSDAKIGKVKEGESAVVRDTPSDKGRELTKVDAGTTLPIIEQDKNRWTKVETSDKTVGWIDEESLNIEEWGQPLGTTGENGVLHTNDLTLFGGEVNIQAIYEERESEIFTFPIYDNLGEASPENIALTVQEDMSTSAGITWRTHPNVNVTKAQVVQASEGFQADTVTEIEGDSFLFETNIGDTRLHEVEVTDLEPGVAYEYRVGDGENWSEKGTFHTTPETEDTFTFLFTTDTQGAKKEDYNYFNEILKKARNHYPDAELMLFGGDMVAYGNNQKEWDYWFEAGEEYFPNMFLAPVPGNHEAIGRGMEYYDAQFQLPKNGPEKELERAYSFDYGSAHFAMLNSEGDLESQAEWLREDIQNSDQTWNIVSLHRSPYHTHTRRSNEEVLEVLAPVIEELNVDLVLAGHDHAYSRTWPMKDGNIVPPDDGVTYVIGGSAGPKLYSVGDFEYVRTSEEFTQVYSGITVDGETMSFEARNIEGDPIDTFTLSKSAKDISIEVENASFEEEAGAEEQVPGWMIVDSHESSIIERTDEYAKNGDFSLRFADNSKEANLRVESKDIPIEQGASYYVGADAFKISQSHSFVFDIGYFNENGENIKNKSTLWRDRDLETEGWTSISTIVTPPEDAAYMRIYFHSGGISLTDMYLDDVVVKKM